ncbi:MAG: ComEC family competence protein [Cyclobacteriaceae bacterium]|nr:ComEC family competence protein [Cyclobacteriaceae bacterium]
MFYWVPYTFVRIVCFLIAGILLGIYQPDSIPERLALLLFVGCVVLFFILAIWKRKINPGVIGLIAIFLAGYLNTLYHTDSRKQNHILHAPSVEKYVAVISGYGEEKEKSWKVEADVQQVFDGAEWKPASGKVMWYFSKKDFHQPYSYGDELMIHGAPPELSVPANPGEFDYKKFLSYRKIYHQQFLRREDVRFVSVNPPSRVMAYSIAARNWAEKVFTKHIEGRQERGVILALVLGVSDELDNDLMQAYAASGAIHVLAVSGLHIAIIYIILVAILKPLNRWKHGKWMLACISIVFLWGYAFITGLSPSVLRAVAMFTVMALSRPFNYGTNIYNTLAVAAFGLLMWEPFMIMSVGFQLSFLAVIGIVYIHPKLIVLWKPKNWVLQKTWDVTCVSIAAQLATFSLGLLYFHQFPVYFLVSNLLVIPGTSVALVAGMVLLAISPIAWLADWLGSAIELLLWVINYFVFAVERLPFSLVNDVYITTFQNWLIIGMVVSALALWQFRKFSFAVLVAGCTVLYGGTQWHHYADAVDQEKFVVYRVAGHHAMEWLDRGSSYFFTDSVLLNNHDRIRFHIRPNRLIGGIHNIRINNNSFTTNLQGCRLFTWKSYTFLHITSPEFLLPSALEVDYIVVSHNSIRNMQQLAQVRFKKLVIDSSNSWYTANRIVNESGNADVRIHSVLHHGAFETKL